MRSVGYRTAAAVALVTLLTAGCTSGSDEPEPTGGTTITRTETRTSSAAPETFVPTAAKTVAPLRPGAKPRAGEKKGRCPYIRSGLNADPTSKPNFADLEGNRVGRTVILANLMPVGCRFYFANPDYHAVGDIQPKTFPTATAAHNAAVLTARAGSSARSYPDFVPGVDGINYQTKYYGPDRGQDWAFAFAKGKVLVVVRTDQTDAPINAVNIARAIATKF